MYTSNMILNPDIHPYIHSIQNKYRSPVQNHQCTPFKPKIRKFNRLTEAILYATRNHYLPIFSKEYKKSGSRQFYVFNDIQTCWNQMYIDTQWNDRAIYEVLYEQNPVRLYTDVEIESSELNDKYTIDERLNAFIESIHLVSKYIWPKMNIQWSIRTRLDSTVSYDDKESSIKKISQHWLFDGYLFDDSDDDNNKTNIYELMFFNNMQLKTFMNLTYELYDKKYRDSFSSLSSSSSSSSSSTRIPQKLYKENIKTNEIERIIDCSVYALNRN
ncbi:unnamed protein product, partial [marine sediment metagenome]